MAVVAAPGGGGTTTTIIQAGDNPVATSVNVTTLLSDTALTYTADQPATIATGDIVQTKAESFSYTVAAPSASDYHLETAGGVKLYAVTDADGWINSEQLGWSNGQNVTTALQRFWPRFQAGDKFLLSHKINVGDLFLTMPQGMTLEAKKPRVDGFNFLSGSWASSGAQFTITSNCAVKGLSITTDITADTSGRVFLGGTANTEGTLVNASIENCVINVPVDVPIYIFGSENFVFHNNQMLSGKWMLTVDYSNELRVTNNLFTGGSHGNIGGEGVKTIQSTVGPGKNAIIAGNTFRLMSRDGVDTTGDLIDSIIENNVFDKCGQLVGGGGGIDIKTTHDTNPSTTEANKRLTIRNNTFISSAVFLVSNFNGDWNSDGVALTTDAEVLELATTDISLEGNTYYPVAGETKFCGLSIRGGARIRSHNESYLNGANPFNFSSETNSGSSAFNRVFQVSYQNLTLELISGGFNIEINRVRDISVHFADLIVTDLAGINGIRIIEGCDRIAFSGSGNVSPQASSRWIFYITEAVTNSSTNISIDLDMSYAGTANHPILCYANQPEPDMGLLAIKNCKLTNFLHALRTRRDGFNTVLIENNNWIDGASALVDFNRLANASTISDARLTGNTCNNNQDLIKSDSDLAGITIATARNNTGFVNPIEVTIASGVLSIFDLAHAVNTEGNASTDDLDTINGGNLGDRLTLVASNSNRTVVAKDGTGNLVLGGDRTLDNTSDVLVLEKRGSSWHQVSFNDLGS